MGEEAMNIQLHIERLGFDGLTLSAGQRVQVQAAVEAELSRLFAAGNIAPALLSGGSFPELSVAGLHVPQNGDPTQLGAQIAQTLYRGLGGGWQR
jgi:hypothetical protein